LSHPTSSPLLLLFDIDGTLIDTGGAGLNALSAAFLDSFGLQSRAEEMPKLELAGSTDGGITRSLCAHFDIVVEDNDPSVRTFYASYLEKLRANLEGSHRDEGHVLPGAPELLHRVREETDHTLALLTGNIADGAWLKVDHFGFEDVFEFGAFGDDHHDRNELGPIALKRARERNNARTFSPDQTVIIGDTPRDVACARACGATAVAVATGKFSAAELEQCEPDHLFENFSDSDHFFRELGL
jgi:phosphoglycolate phosphatase-like HAD superfamily hydrolase